MALEKLMTSDNRYFKLVDWERAIDEAFSQFGEDRLKRLAGGRRSLEKLNLRNLRSAMAMFF